MNTEQFDGHTPGPWDADYDPYVATLDKGESMDVLTIRVPTSEDGEVAWTNQHLAAAAPDLLDLLIDARRMVKDLYALLERVGHEDDAYNWASKNIGYIEMAWWNPEACVDEDPEVME